MAKKTETTALVKEETKAVGQVMDYSDFGGSGAGYEGQTSEDTALPFFALLQPMTPAVVDQTVEGATPGMIMNNVTKLLYTAKKPLICIPVFTKHEYILWKPRKAGGGFIARYDIDDPIVAKAKSRSTKFGKYFIPPTRNDAEEIMWDAQWQKRFDEDQGDELQETFTVFMLECGLDPEDQVGMAIFPFKSSMIKTYKSWMSTVRAHTVLGADGKRVTPPLFAHLAALSGEMTKKNGNTWAIPKYVPAINGKVIESCLAPDDPRFQAAFQMYTFVRSGQAKVDYTKMQQEDGEGDGVAQGDDGIPTGPDGKKLF